MNDIIKNELGTYKKILVTDEFTYCKLGLV